MRVFEFLMKVVNMFKRIINVTTSERFPFDIFYETKGTNPVLKKVEGNITRNLFNDF